MRVIRVATRKSNLALIQTDEIIGLIEKKLKVKCEKKLFSTKGDEVLDTSLEKIGGKGLFIKELEKALLLKEADIAVHSMKDVPTLLEEPFEICAVPVREDPRDVFISFNRKNFYAQKKGARIGTSSVRRGKQLLLLRKDLNIVPIRGNVETRLEKLKSEDLDGIVLAAAGIKRLGLEEYITGYFELDEMIPACGQGAIAVEALRGSEIAALIKGLDNEEVRICIEAERTIMRILNGGCHTPVAAHARIEGEWIKIWGVNQVGDTLVKLQVKGKKEDYLNLSCKLAMKLLEG
ncbi:hydroxymethylbilane synthase [Thermovenabulum sp.]|uniref:hydroxymethylbilane synthase n=1 Tax=Thermovenabulum sp. TaxID=3100335 RepID=UPI003C7C9767